MRHTYCYQVLHISSFIIKISLWNKFSKVKMFLNDAGCHRGFTCEIFVYYNILWNLIFCLASVACISFKRSSDQHPTTDWLWDICSRIRSKGSSMVEEITGWQPATTLRISPQLRARVTTIWVFLAEDCQIVDAFSIVWNDQRGKLRASCIDQEMAAASNRRVFLNKSTWSCDLYRGIGSISA